MKPSKKIILFFLIPIFFIFLFSIWLNSIYSSPLKNTHLNSSNLPNIEANAISFLNKNMITKNYLVYTNFKEYRSIFNLYLKKDNFLSESQGILLQYFLNRNSKQDFDNTLKSTNNAFLLSNNIYSWKSYGLTKENTNALLDDLRILRAIDDASSKWTDSNYKKLLLNYSKSLYLTNFKNGFPHQFYSQNDILPDKIPLFYLDIIAIESLSKYYKPYDEVVINSRNILSGALIPNSPKLYTSYNYSTKHYEYDERINMVEFLYTAIHLQEAGFDISNTINWIQDEFFKNKKLYLAYDGVTMSPASNLESTAVYALASQLFLLDNKKSVAILLLDKSTDFQVNSDSVISGSFGNEDTLTSFSFDNLQYILTSSLLYETNK